MLPYRHRQVGWVVLGAFAAAAMLVLATFTASGAWWAGLLTAGALGVMALLFGWLTVEAGDGWLTIRFGIGLVRRRWPLDEIVRVETVRNPWWTGWGIRWIPGRRVYNVSGLGAVEFVLANGRAYRIGSDEPGALAAAIEQLRGPG